MFDSVGFDLLDLVDVEIQLGGLRGDARGNFVQRSVATTHNGARAGAF